MQLDADFVADHPCAGRAWMGRLQRAFLDVVCRWIGHNLWRPGTVRQDVDHSLPHWAVYCRRCLKGGYVRGDYKPS